MRATQCRNWTAEELSAQLRGSVALVEDILSGFVRAQIVIAEQNRRYRYRPIDRATENLVYQLAKIEAEYPMAIVKEIVRAPNEKIRVFVDAFRFKRD